MKMYKEMLRKLLPVGMPLAVATLIYTVIVSGQNYFGTSTINTAQSAIGFTPALVYYAFSAILFALYGFSFLFKRSASDLYHSLPVTRLDLYLSVTLGTASWMGGTIVMNVLLTALLALIGGIPFVPAYVPMLILFYFVASMLVFAATAIGCAVSGTLVTALASTGVVLFAPRFIQFIIARGIVAKVPIVGWLDLGWLLTPTTNVATGLVVMHSRQVFMARIVTLPNILLSVLPMALELALAAWLFIRRPSETADRGAGRKGWAVAIASLMALIAMSIITVDSHRLISVYGAALVAIAFLVFVAYQFIAARSIKQVAASLPFFALAAAVALGVSGMIQSTADRLLNETPAAADIAYVTFRGTDERADEPSYSTLLLRDIRYTAQDMKQYVAETLTRAADRIKEPDEYGYYTYNQYQVIEPIAVTLQNGQTLLRTIEFTNINELNALREKEPLFEAAIRALPPEGAIQFRSTESTFTKEETLALWSSYRDETQTLKLICDDYYRQRSANDDAQDNYLYQRGGQQTVSSIFVAGYIGSQRFSDAEPLRLELPKTIALLLQTYNAHSKAGTTERLYEAARHIVSPLALENDNLGLNIDFYNLPLSQGDQGSWSVGIFLSSYSRQNDPSYTLYVEYLQKFADILRRGTFATDPEGLFIRLNWYEYDSSNPRQKSDPVCFLSFTPEDEQAMITLVQEWLAATTL